MLSIKRSRNMLASPQYGASEPTGYLACSRLSQAQEPVYQRDGRLRSLASLTRRGRPPTSLPFSSAMAFCASLSGISTNPKPRERPVSRSVITAADCTSPIGLNISDNSWSFVLQGKFPTYIFILDFSRFGQQHRTSRGRSFQHHNQLHTRRGCVPLRRSDERWVGAIADLKRRTKLN